METTAEKQLRFIRDFESLAQSHIDEQLSDQWRKNEKGMRLEHYNDRINTDPKYKHRSKLFIPKIKTAVYRILASIIMEYFSSPDALVVKSMKDFKPQIAEASKVLQKVTNYRLEETLNWFLVCVLACRDILVFGRGAAAVGWDYQEEEYEVKELVDKVDENGDLVLDENGYTEVEEITTTEIRVVKDEPYIRHIKLWNILLDPDCDPVDPVNSSPVLIEKVPVYIHEVLGKIKSGEWEKPECIKEAEDWEQFLWENNPIQSEVEGETRNNQRAAKTKSEWKQIEIWKVCMIWEGEDLYFETLKDRAILTEPEPVSSKFPCKGRPYVFGGADPDSNSIYWAGFPEGVEGLQRELNAIRNQRRDNVNLALNKRMLVRKTAGISLQSLMFNRPGAPIMADDISEYSIRELKVDDVTASSYREEDVNRRDFEEASGIGPYNQGSLRPGMNKTATGTMSLIEQSNMPIGMTVSIISRTFVKPLLEMVVQFEQAFENEEVIRNVCGKAGIDFDAVWNEEAIENKYSVEIFAGIGHTSRDARYRSLGMIIDRALAINSQYGMPVLDVIGMVRDALPLSGHKNPDQYINGTILEGLMRKFGQTLNFSMSNAAAPPPNVANSANSGQSGIESMQGYGGEPQPYRGEEDA
jgi:hypothetical protein